MNSFSVKKKKKKKKKVEIRVMGMKFQIHTQLREPSVS